MIFHFFEKSAVFLEKMKFLRDCFVRRFCGLAGDEIFNEAVGGFRREILLEKADDGCFILLKSPFFLNTVKNITVNCIKFLVAVDLVSFYQYTFIINSVKDFTIKVQRGTVWLESTILVRVLLACRKRF